MPDIFVDTVEPEQRKHINDHARQSVTALLHHKKQSMGLFAAFCLKPEGLAFTNQEPDEEILLFLRRHVITNVPWIINSVLLSLIPPALFGLTLIPGVFPFSLPLSLLIVLTLFYYLLIIGYAFGNFISWFYNIGIVTQKRVIDLDSSNILSHNSATANFSEVVDVKFTQNGFFQSFFHYGDVHIQTEAILANFEFFAAPNPTKVSDIISDLRVTRRGEKHGIS